MTSHAMLVSLLNGLCPKDTSARCSAATLAGAPLKRSMKYLRRHLAV